MNYLIDTCVISDFFKKIPETITHFERCLPKQIHISTISIMEVEYGLKLNIEREKKLRPLWETLLKEISIVPYIESCARETAIIRSNLKTLGQPIGPYDILIAGTALAHHLIVVTSNISEFKRIPSLSIEDWREAIN
jgi:tRNA(fMet)-specific endonuclease VapC